MTDWSRAFIEDGAQFRSIVASRQSGKSHTLATDSVVEAVSPTAPLEVILSRGERQSLEVIAKVKQQCQAMGMAFGAEDSFFGDTSLLQHTVTFPNGYRIVGLPANPDTARGYSGHLKLDEFGVHRDSMEIWKAAAPIATRGFRITLASTFKGKENKFYQVMNDLGLADGVRPQWPPVRKNGWSGHWVDIYMAAEQNRRCLGLSMDVEKLHQAIGDEDIWMEEFLNIPMSDAADYISLEQVLACEDDDVARLVWDEKPAVGLCGGWDFARKRDRSVIILGMEIAGLLVVSGVIYLDRMTFDAQYAAGRQIVEMVQHADGTFAMDAGGNGAMIAEKLQKEFACVQAVQFGGRVGSGAKDDQGKAISELVKVRIARDLKQRFENRTLRIPASPALRRAVRAIKRMTSPTGNVIIDAARTEQGHGDEFWALALLNGAVAGSTGYVAASEGGVMGRPVMGGLMGRVF